jgi:hypothetical protein
MRAAIRHCKSKFSRCSWNGDIYVPYHFQFLQYVVKLGGIIYPFVTRIIHTDTCIQTGVVCQQTQLWPFRKKISLLSGPWETFPEEESGPRVSCLFFTLTWPFMPCLSLPRPSPSSHPWNGMIHSIGSVSILNATRSSQHSLEEATKLQKGQCILGITICIVPLTNCSWLKLLIRLRWP